MLATGSLTLSAAERAEGPVVAYPEGRKGLLAESILLPNHTHRRDVIAKIGPPDAILSPDAWIYWNYRTNQPNRSAGLDALMISFRDDRVESMKVVYSQAVRNFLATRDRSAVAAVTPRSPERKRKK